MSKRGSLESLLEKAKKREKEYAWLEAAELYEQAFGGVQKRDFLKKGEIQERSGYCFYRAAFQADTQEEFKKHMRLSAKAYEEAARLFENMKDTKNHTRMNYCRGMASYSQSWLAEESTERKETLETCRRILKEALKVYHEAGDQLGYGKTANDLSDCLGELLFFVWNSQELRNISEEAIEYGEKAIKTLSDVKNEYELARTYCLLSGFESFASVCFESIEKQTEIREKSLAHAQKALEISRKTGDLTLIGRCSWAVGYLLMDFKGNLDSAQKHFKKLLEMGTKTKDNLLLALGFQSIEYLTTWKMSMEEDPDRRRKGLNKALEIAEDARIHYQLFIYPFTADMDGVQLDCYFELAVDSIDLEEKQLLLDKAIKVGRESLEKAKCSGSQYGVHTVLHSLSKLLFSRSSLEAEISNKRRLLGEALEHRDKMIKLSKQLAPFHYWNQGVSYSYSGLIKAEMANTEMDNQEKEKLLEKAVADMENCLEFCQKELSAHSIPMLLGTFGTYQDRFGSILNQLYSLTGEQEYLERAIEVFGDAVQAWERVDLHSRVAEGHWQVARLYDILRQHSKAAREFESASKRYNLAAEKIPQLKAFYIDYAVYMQAWSEIEKAKGFHSKKRYGQAKKHYEKVANLHESTERWNYMRHNYLAWARLEEAEAVSRREQAEEARDLFKQAVSLFADARKPMSERLKSIEDKDEREMVAELIKASSVRREYCLGRIALEKAKILDRKGDHEASSRKYGSATLTFQRIAGAEPEQSRRELQPIILLCQAWEMMTRAEDEALPNLYLKASKLFGEAKEISLSEDDRILALGHSSFCKALEAGAKFEATRDTKLHLEATRHLESASSYYLRAGFKNASEYSRATHRLFDAYMYAHKAETVTDPRKKAQYYQMAERLLQTSAGSFMKAQHPEKTEEVGRLLEGIKEERKLAMSLTEVLHAPTITSTTASFSTPTPTPERAVGLGKFEHADIQANLILRVKEVKVGEDVSFAIELVNAGKAPALLIKVDEIVPEGFEIKQVPETYTVEDSYVNMKGKRLNPLKTEDVKMVIKPRSKGTFIVKPRILYIDETGKYHAHEPEPVTITVKELGIKGWIKGER